MVAQLRDSFFYNTATLENTTGGLPSGDTFLLSLCSCSSYLFPKFESLSSHNFLWTLWFPCFWVSFRTLYLNKNNSSSKKASRLLIIMLCILQFIFWLPNLNSQCLTLENGLSLMGKFEWQRQGASQWPVLSVDRIRSEWIKTWVGLQTFGEVCCAHRHFWAALAFFACCTNSLKCHLHWWCYNWHCSPRSAEDSGEMESKKIHLFWRFSSSYKCREKRTLGTGWFHINKNKQVQKSIHHHNYSSSLFISSDIIFLMGIDEYLSGCMNYFLH